MNFLAVRYTFMIAAAIPSRNPGSQIQRVPSQRSSMYPPPKPIAIASTNDSPMVPSSPTARIDSDADDLLLDVGSSTAHYLTAVDFAAGFAAFPAFTPSPHAANVRKSG